MGDYYKLHCADCGPAWVRAEKVLIYVCEFGRPPSITFPCSGCHSLREGVTSDLIDAMLAAGARQIACGQRVEDRVRSDPPLCRHDLRKLERLLDRDDWFERWHSYTIRHHRCIV